MFSARGSWVCTITHGNLPCCCYFQITAVVLLWLGFDYKDGASGVCDPPTKDDTPLLISISERGGGGQKIFVECKMVGALLAWASSPSALHGGAALRAKSYMAPPPSC